MAATSRPAVGPGDESPRRRVVHVVTDDPADTVGTGGGRVDATGRVGPGHGGHAARTGGAVVPVPLDLHRAIARLALAATEEFDIEDMLRRLCDAAAAALAVDGVGVMGVDMGRSRFVQASHPVVTPLEELQAELQMGPCRDAIDAGALVTATTDHEIATSWPAFHVLTARQGIRAVVALPLMSRGQCWGTLDLYWTGPHRIADDELAAAQLLADVAVSYLVMAADRAASQAAQEQLASRALHDQLTGLPNRGLIHELLFHALAAAQRRESLVAVLFVDLDRFKSVNDTYGHSAGDLVLQEVARRLRATVRTGDAVGRLSGDEFVVLCEDLPAGTDDLAIVAARLAYRIGLAVAEPIALASGALTVTLTASVGVAVTAERPSAADLIHEADAAMYEAKAAGPGRWVLRTELSAEEQHSRRGTERQLFEALARDQFSVHYQPITDPGGAVVAVEALLRWSHPVRGLIAAGEFIDIAESTGAIVPIGHWMIRRAVTDLGRWRAAHPGTAPGMVLCNLGPRELIDPELPRVLTSALAEAGLEARHLGLEIIESHLADPRLLECASRLHAMGHPLAIDDFGTGYSSLARLVDMPVSYLKIDRSLVSGLPGDRRSQTLVRAILTIAQELGVQVIGEGIETRGQVDHLVAAGTALMQGYLLGRPVPADRFVADHLAAPAAVTPPPAGDPHDLH